MSYPECGLIEVFLGRSLGLAFGLGFLFWHGVSLPRGQSLGKFKLNHHPDGTSLDYSTFFNGGSGIAVNQSSEAVIVGASNAEVAELNAAGSSLVYSTKLSSSIMDDEIAIALDSSGDAFVLGAVTVPDNYSLLSPIQGYSLDTNQEAQATVAELDPSGNLVWSTFFGGPTSDPLFAAPYYGHIAVDGTSNAYILAPTTLAPTTPGSLEPTFNLNHSNQNPFQISYFLAKIAPSLGAPVPIVFFPSSAAFGNGVVGMATSAQDVPIGNFGDAALAAPTVSIIGDFSQTNTCSEPVPAGQKCDISVTFNPTVTGTRTRTLTVSFEGSFPSQTVQLSGTGTAPHVSLSSNSLDFPPQAIGTSSTVMQITLTNSGTTPLTITSLPIMGDFGETNTCGSPVTVSGTCTLQVTFTPTAQGFRNGTISITDDAPGSPQVVEQQGYGGSATTATLSPASLAFGSQAVGITSAAQTLTLTNTGANTMAIASISASGDFAESNTCGSLLSEGASCQITVTFTPTATSTRSGAVGIVDNTAQTPQSVALTGTGASASLGLSMAAPGSNSLTLQPGASGSYMLSIGGAGIAATASLSCTGAPTGATCAVPATVAVSASTATTITVSVTTTARSGLVLWLSEASNGWPDLSLLEVALAVAMIAVGIAFAKNWRVGFA